MVFKLRSFALAAVMFCLTVNVWGQTLLLTDDFTGYTVGGNLSGSTGGSPSGTWTKNGSGPDGTITSTTTMTYAGYNGGGGNYVSMSPTGTGSRVYKGFTATTAVGNTFYVSFLLRLSATTVTGDYFISLGDAGTNTGYGPRLFAKTSGAGFVLGVSKSQNVASAIFGSTVLSLNTTYLIVMRFSGVSGSTNDLAYVWVNPSLASEPTTGSAECSDNAGADVGYSSGNVGNFHYHNRSINNPTGSFDAVRVATASTSANAWTALAAAQTISITSATPATACAGTGVPVVFTSTGAYNSGNVFTAQLSDQNGSFATPTNIGTLTSTSAGTINAILPASLTSGGTGYKIQVVSSNPVITSGASSALSISTYTAPTTVTPATASLCAGTSMSIGLSPLGHSLFGSSGTTPLDGTPSGVATMAWTGSAGSYTLAGTSGGSGNVQFTFWNGIGTCKRTVEYTVNATPGAPTSPSATPGSSCSPGNFTLSATGSGDILNWYDNSNNYLTTGSSYAANGLTVTTNYKVRAAKASAQVVSSRPSATTTTSLLAPSSSGLVFSANQFFVLNSVDIFPSATGGTITFTLQNSSGVTMQTSSPISITSGNTTTPFTATLNFNVPAGTGYRLIATSSTTLIRELSPPAFPFSIGSSGGAAGSITNGFLSPNANSIYYFFYNWKVTPYCESAATTVTANITTYTINASAGANGSISSPGITTHNCGATPSYTITPDGGYAIQDVKVDGVSVGTGSTYNFTALGANHTIVATFVSASANTINLTPTVNFGSFCNTGANTVSVSYTTNGTVTAPLIIQLSNNAASFASGTANLTTTEPVAGTLEADIPANQTAGTYRVRIISSDVTPIESNDNGYDITISPPVSVSITETDNSGTADDGKVCSGGSATLTATAGYTYSWSTGSSAQAISPTNITTNTTYTVTASNAGCSSTTNYTVTAVSAPSVSIAETDNSGTADDGKVCSGGSATLTATAGYTYAWSTGPTTQAISPTNITANTTYTVTASTAGCTSTTNYTVTVATSAVSITETDNSGTTNDGKVCSGGSATLTATAGYSYSWSTSATTQAISPTNITTNTTYTVTANNAGCLSTDNYTVTAVAAPSVAITETDNSGTADDGKVCSGGSATLTATAGYTYNWSTGATTQAISPTNITTNTTYTVTAGTAGCTSSTNYTITVTTAPAAPVANNTQNPTSPQTTNVNATDFTANWSTVSGATGYQLDVYTGGSQTIFTENFTGFTGSGFQQTPAAGQLSSNVWRVTGWSDGALTFGGTRTTANTDYTRGTSTGGVTTGGMYGFNVGGGNIALGFQPGGSDWAPGTLVLRVLNTTGSTITSLDVSYKIYVYNDGDRSNSFNFAHSSDDASYTSVGALDYTSPAALDASPAWTLVNRSTTITGLSVANNTYYYLRWNGADVGGSSTRDEFALDDVSVTATSQVYVSGYQNLSVGGTTQVVSGAGITSGNTYTYVARAVNECGASVNSNPVQVTTTTTTYDITASAGANGSISPSGTVAVNSGADQSFTITPNSGYLVADVVIDGTTHLGSVTGHTFSGVTGPHSIHATFVAISYTLTTGTVPSFVCPGATFTVPYTINYPATSGNVFSVELSNASGVFAATPPVIGTVTATGSGNITATMPSTASGNGYKVRVTASTPALTGSASAAIMSQFSTSAPLFTESMGNSGTSGGVTVGTYESGNSFDNDAFTMSSTGTTTIRDNSFNSNGYLGATGNSHVFLPAATTSAGFRINCNTSISTSGVTPLTLNFGVTKSSNADDGSGLLLEVSSNGGTNWTAVSFTALQTGSGTGDGYWQLVRVINAIPSTTNLSIRFTNTNASGGTYYRIDDINLYTGTASSGASISPSSPPTQCAGTVILTASPANNGYTWTGGGSTSATFATTSSGSYSVTVTDQFGCQSSAGPVSVNITVPVTPSVTIANTNSTICTDVPQTFTSSVTNAGTPTYQWNKNGTAIPGATGSTYAPAANTLSNGDVITLSITPTGCVTTPTAASNALTAQHFAYQPQNTVWTETFGSGTAYSSPNITGYTGYTNGQTSPAITWTMSLPNYYPSIETTNPPGSYFNGGTNPNPSGSKLYFSTTGTAGGTYSCTMNDINTSNAFPNTLSFWMYNDGFSVSYTNFGIDYSVDGTNFSPVNYGTTGSATGWYFISLTNALPKSPNLKLRFTQKSGVQIRIDDLKLSKYTVGDIAVAPTGTITLCTGSQTLTSSANPIGTSGYTTLWSTGANTAAITVSTPGTYTVTLTDAFGCKSSASRTVNAYTGTQTWNGTNHNWNDATNWGPCGNVPTATDNVEIPVTANDPVISGTPAGICKNLTINSGAGLTIDAGQFLNVNGNVVNDGNSDFGAGTLSMEGTGSATVTGTITIANVDIAKNVTVNPGTSLSITESLELESGTFTNSGSVVLKSSSSGNAYLDNFTGTNNGIYSGNLTQEVYVPTSGIHMLGGMASTFNIANELTELNLSSSINPGNYIISSNCNSLQTASNSPYGPLLAWDEGAPFPLACAQEGYKVIASGSATGGQGFAATIGAGTTVSVTGIPNMANPAAANPSRAVTKTPGATINTPTQSGTSVYSNNGATYTTMPRGWNLVANPFNAPWKWTRNGNANVGATAYRWVTTGNFRGTYQPVVENTDVIAIGQGIFVLALDNTTLEFDAANRQASNTAVFLQTTSGPDLEVVVSGNNFSDVTNVRFNDQSTNQFDYEMDALKPWSNMSQPTLFTDVDGRKTSINNLHSITSSPNVQMGLFPGTNGTYTLSFNNLNSFDPTSYIYLEDKQTGGAWLDVRQNNTYTFTSTTTDAVDRFVLHFTPAAEIATIDQQCNTPGSINITQPGTAQWQYTVADGSGNTIGSGMLNQTSPVTVTAPAGTYTLTLIDSNNYTVMKSVVVNGTSPIVAVFTPSPTTAETGDDITFTSTTPNAATTAWDFGDGHTSADATAVHSYAAAGTYTVSLTATNADGCTNTNTQTITVTEKVVSGLSNLTNSKGINIWSSENRVFIDFSKQTKVEAEIQIYNVLGQLLVNEKFGRNTVYSKPVTNLEAAYVIVKVMNEDVITTKKVFVWNK